MTNVPYKTMGFCATCERYTEHHCSRCAEHDTAMLPQVDLALVAEVQKLRQQVADMQLELDARANILNRAVTAKLHKFPAELGNDWIGSIDRLDTAIVELRREKSKMRAALQMTIDSIEDHRNKVEMPPVLYGILTHIVLEVSHVLDEV